MNGANGLELSRTHTPRNCFNLTLRRIMLITITCPDCGKKIKINIKTIDKLKKELEDVKAQLTALEMKNRTRSNNLDIDDFFGGIFK